MEFEAARAASWEVEAARAASLDVAAAELGGSWDPELEGREWQQGEEREERRGWEQGEERNGGLGAGAGDEREGLRGSSAEAQQRADSEELRSVGGARRGASLETGEEVHDFFFLVVFRGSCCCRLPFLEFRVPNPSASHRARRCGLQPQFLVCGV
jgi:hypothetical protein